MLTTMGIPMFRGMTYVQTLSDDVSPKDTMELLSEEPVVILPLKSLPSAL
jgi:hypothetical protein